MASCFRLKRKLGKYKLVLVVCLFIAIYNVTKGFFHEHDQNCPYAEPIDVVYTWVNGSDTGFRETLKEYYRLNGEQLEFPFKRYDDKYELKFSLRSLEKFAPWINHVYIVTNGQIPYWLDLDYKKVSIVTHEEIFRDDYNLPTFSSPAIEMNLHRIPGLSKRFIYFNDDIFLGAPTYFEDFHSPNKGHLIYLSYSLPPCSENCSWLYVGDGQCDSACYTYQCQRDGGDCDNENDKHAVQYSTEIVPTFTKTPETSINITVESFKDILRNSRLKNFTKIIHKYNRKKLRKMRLKPFKQPHPTLIDTYSESLQHTQRMLNLKYGFKVRKVPSHAPIMIDKEIMENLIIAFEKEFFKTERNKVRSFDDMQYSFSYYYYLISETVEHDIESIFDMFDTDSSGTWSDREIRTLLTRLYELPLSYLVVEHFDAMLYNCTEKHGIYLDVTTPLYERYMDSQLPTIPKELIIKCQIVSRILKERFGKYPKYKHKILKNVENNHVTFVMLHSNASEVVMNLDLIRSNPTKFICLNDDLDYYKLNENELVKSILYDFYHSLFPKPSKFELPDDFRNKFSNVKELNEWKEYHFYVNVFISCAIFIVVKLCFPNLIVKVLDFCFNMFCC